MGTPEVGLAEWEGRLCASLTANADREHVRQLCQIGPATSQAVVAEKLLILVQALRRFGGQYAEVLLPEVAKALPQLASAQPGIHEEHAHVLSICTRLAAGLRSIIHSAEFPGQGRATASQAVGHLLQELVAAAVAPVPAQAGASSSAAATQIPGLTVLRAFVAAVPDSVGHPGLPLLPNDAYKLVQSTLNIIQKGSGSQSLYQDDIIPWLVARLVAAAGSPVPSGPGLTGTASVPAQEMRETLGQAAAWAHGIVQAALSAALPGGNAAPPGSPWVPPGVVPSSAVTSAAAHLCAEVVHGLAGPASSRIPSAGQQLSVQQGSSVAPAAGLKLTPGLAQQVEEVAESLLDIAELSIAAAADASVASAAAANGHTGKAGHSSVTPPEVTLAHASEVLRGLAALLPAAAHAHIPVGSILSRLKGIALAAATLAPISNSIAAGSNSSTTSRRNTATEAVATSASPGVASGVTSAWSWDVSHPLSLTAATLGRAAAADLEHSGGSNAALWRAAQVAAVSSEGLAAGLAAAWQEGEAALCHAMLLVPDVHASHANEVKVMALIAARTLVLLRGEPLLCRSLVPLLTEALAAAGNPAPVVAAFGTTRPPPASTSAANGTSRAVPSGSTFDVLAHALAAIAAEVAVHQHGSPSDLWAYEQVTDLLIRMYRDTPAIGSTIAVQPAVPAPGRTVAVAPAAAKREPLLPGIAAALCLLSKRVASGGVPLPLLSDLRLRLLSLFLNLGLLPPVTLAKSDYAMSHAQLQQALGGLLPAIAAVCVAAHEAGADNGHSILNGGNGYGNSGGHGRAFGNIRGASTHARLASSSRLSYVDITRTLKEEANLVKLYRSFWLYTALHDLACPEAPAAWRDAAGRIAGATPVMLAGLETGSDMDGLERLKVELSDRLAHAGAVASPERLGSRLLSAVGERPGSNRAPVPPADAVRKAYLLAVAVCETARVSLAPLPRAGATCPAAYILAYLQVARSGTEDAAWYAAITSHVVRSYLTRIEEARASALTATPSPFSAWEAWDVPPPGGDGTADSTADVTSAPPGWPSLSAFQQYVISLYSSTMPPPATPMGGQLGAKVLAVRCDAAVQGLAVTLIEHLTNLGGHEEGSASPVVVSAEKLLTQLLSRYTSLYWSHACMAALLGMLEQEEGDIPLGSVRGHTSTGGASTVVWKVLKEWVYAAALVAPTRTEALLHQFLGTTPAGLLTANEVDGTASAATAAGTVSMSSGLGIPASSAALRRAADLLALVAEARARQEGVPVTQAGAGAAALALCRKQLYTGVVLGLQHQVPPADDPTGDQSRTQSVLVPLSGATGGTAGGTSAVPSSATPSRPPSAARRVEAALQAAIREQRGPTALEESYLSAAALLALSTEDEPEEEGGDEQTGLQAYGRGGLQLAGSLYGSDSYGAGSCTDELVAEAQQGAAVFGMDITTEGGVGGLGSMSAAQRRQGIGLVSYGPSRQWGAAEDGRIALRLVHALCTVPLQRFHPQVMALAVFAWTWVTTAAPGWLDSLMCGCAAAWAASVVRGQGLFSGKPGPSTSDSDQAQHAASAHQAGQALPGREELVQSSQPEVEDEAALLQGLSCHRQWLSFFSEALDATGGREHAGNGAVRQALALLVSSSLQNPSQLSHHPAAASARFRLLHLALRFTRTLQLEAEEQMVALTTQQGQKAASQLQAVYVLQDQVLKAGLEWFQHAPTYTAHLSQAQSEEQVASLREFVTLLSRLSPNAWAQLPGLVKQGTIPNPAAAHALLLFLCERELDRLQVWAMPLGARTPTAAPRAATPFTSGASSVALSSMTDDHWRAHMTTAWEAHPQLAVALVSRFPAVPALRSQLGKLLVAGALTDPRVQQLPEAALLLATVPGAGSGTTPALSALSSWEPGTAVHGLCLISGPSGGHPAVRAYAVRCLRNTPPEQVAFFLPQLVQCLRHDDDGVIATALLQMAADSDLFAHQLMWALMTEEKPPTEAFNPEVKRSGWQPPRDYGLWEVAGSLRSKVLSSLSPASRVYWEEEEGYFNKVTSISGILKKVPKDERRGAIAAELAKFRPSRPDLYVPTNPDCRVVGHIPTSGTPMQSAAKVPILVAFRVEQQPDGTPVTLTPLHQASLSHSHSHTAQPGAIVPAGGSSSAAGGTATPTGAVHHAPSHSAGLKHGLPSMTTSAAATGSSPLESQQQSTGTAVGPLAAQASANGDGVEGETGVARVDTIQGEGPVRTLACIFKVGDDCRQDVLALQVIQLLKDAFDKAGLPAYLCPYGVLPNGYERGIVEVVPNAKSRAALGELSDRGLHDIFAAEFGTPGSPAFEAARSNFIASEAGYAIASFLLQSKDRHNGNILISKDGHLVHIDFGFILEISPGGNMGFESAAFKLSHEMTQLLDPGNTRTSAVWARFEELCIRGYLAARTVAEPIIATVALMAESGLPCFGRGAPVENLRSRFHLEMSERQAAAFMRSMIGDAYQKWTTGFYDYIQALQNRIPY